MLKTKIIAGLITGCLLSACGGGSSSSPDVPSGNGNGSGNSTLTFQANVIQETMCGTTSSSSNAELLVHDQNWKVLSRHKADATGKISASITGASNANISLITFSTGSNAEFVVSSYAQHPVVNLGTILIPGKTQQGCECQSTNVRVTSSVGTLNTSSVQLTGFSSPEQRKTLLSNNEVMFEQVGLCRATNGSWPLLTAFANNGTPDAIAGSIRQYNVNNDVELLLNQSAAALPISINSSNASLLEIHYTETGASTARSRSNSNEAYVFNQLDGVTFVTLRASQSQFDVVDGGNVFRTSSQRQNLNTPLSGSVILNIPNTDAMSALENFLFRDLQSNNNSYNLGSIQGFNTFYLYAQTTLTDGTRFFQSFIGPLQGFYPDEIVPADYGIENKLDDNISSTIAASVIRYGDDESYQQYLLNQVERSALPFASRMTGKWSKYSTVSLQVTTSN
ncbi:hypothetical protein [Rheinheimera sp. UJ63]|uniref:hypothetical protein n=1 Tax=Rheinheimera sp. UJ63 TaxID=2910157 RepID=UPI001F3AFE34|nr:hypothetical protein [Rheinheimera sp. UJ63]MCF4010888.1 hypothetical protein [Rheinheimera sp. UJ63]